MERNNGTKEKEKRETNHPSNIIGQFSGKDILGSSHPKEKKIDVKLYDFKRPDKFSRDQIRTLSIIHETYARLSKTSLSVMLRYMCDVHVESVDQMTFGEYLQQIPGLTTMAIINMDPLMGSALMQIDNTLTFSIIERLAGRTEVTRADYNRDLTDIELSLMEAIVVRLLGNLRESWSTVIDLKPRLGQIETNPQFAQIVPPMEMVSVVVFKCKIHTVEDRISFCFPFLTIEPIIAKLSAQYWYSSVRKNQSHKEVFPVSRFKTNSCVFYKTEKISLNRLHNLSKGSLIKIPGFKKGEAALSCGKEDLLKLKAINGKTSHPTFKIIENTNTTKMETEGFLIGEGRNTHKTQGDRINDTIREIFLSYEEKLLQKYTIIEKTIKEVSFKQAELSDQLYFGSKDKDLQEDEPDKNLRPFHFLHSFEIDHIFNFIRREHPQVIALILAYIEPFYSSELLQKFPPQLQIDIAERIAMMDRTHPDILHEIEMVLKSRLVQTEKIITAGGIDSIVEILNLAKRDVEKTILKGLEEKNKKLSEVINRKMFLFDHIRFLDPEAIKMVLEKTTIKNILLALKGSSRDVQEHVLNCLNDRERDDARKNLERLGPVRKEDLEIAQKEIIGIIHKLENEGSIVISYTGEPVE
ncbi:MAG: hypothetical protein JXJ04_08815 [Spirochaetales bacterium]|nr:hypothetical protein [Spirochaetales bacterium]